MRTTVLSYGLGADSTAILLKFLADPAAYGLRPDLSDLVLVHAVTGNEWPDSLDYVATGKCGYWTLRNDAASLSFVDDLQTRGSGHRA
jgi:hypothetical protein